VIGLDTNVLVRHLVDGDSPTQRAAVEELLAQATPKDPAYVSLVTVIETVWVLRQGYKYPAAQVLGFVAQLLRAPEIVVEDAELLISALSDATSKGVDLADAVIARSGTRARCATTYTFDRKAAGLVVSSRDS
jgi:predicted nucleic-acid-binding protein